MSSRLLFQDSVASMLTIHILSSDPWTPVIKAPICKNTPYNLWSKNETGTSPWKLNPCQTELSSHNIATPFTAATAYFTRPWWPRCDSQGTKLGDCPVYLMKLYSLKQALYKQLTTVFPRILLFRGTCVFCWCGSLIKKEHCPTTTFFLNEPITNTFCEDLGRLTSPLGGCRIIIFLCPWLYSPHPLLSPTSGQVIKCCEVKKPNASVLKSGQNVRSRVRKTWNWIPMLPLPVQSWVS